VDTKVKTSAGKQKGSNLFSSDVQERLQAVSVSSQTDFAGYTYSLVGTAVPRLGLEDKGHMQCSFGNTGKKNQFHQLTY